MDPTRKRVQTQRKKFYSAEELEWRRKVKRSQRQANLYCLGFVGLAVLLAYLFKDNL